VTAPGSIRQELVQGAEGSEGRHFPRVAAALVLVEEMMKPAPLRL